MRTFETGATRDTDTGKYDYEGFLSPLVLEAFGAYMHKHRIQPDGNLRDSDNWQKGIPKPTYMKSMWRHFVQVWKLHRGLGCADEKGNPVTMEEALCATMFNNMGYLHEYLKNPQPADAELQRWKYLRDALSKMPEPERYQSAMAAEFRKLDDKLFPF